jgi:signal peptidase II
MGVIPADSVARVSTGMRWAMPGVALLVLAVDQVSKSLILASHVTAAGTGWVVVRLVRNTGASGGIASGHPVLVTLAGLLIAAGAIVFTLRARGRVTALCLAVACGGAIGNLSDRLLRSPGAGRGAVVDWIHVGGGGGSFNVADLAIQFGALGAVIAMLAAERAARPRRHAGEQPGEG